MTTRDGSHADHRADAAARPLALVCLSTVPWGTSWKRVQSLTHQLAEQGVFERVAFVDPYEIWALKELTARGRGPRERWRRLRSAWPRRVTAKVRVLGIVRFLPGLGAVRTRRAWEERWFLAAIERAIGNRPFVLLDNNPDFPAPDVADRLAARAVLRAVDLSDDFAEYHHDPGQKARTAARMRETCARADVVFSINEHLVEKYAADHPRAHVVANGTNYENFDRRSYRPVEFMERIREQGEVVLGYSGIVNRVRVDYELLEEMVTMRPRWQFVFVGSEDPSFRELVARHANLHHHPAVDYEQLPDYLAPVDVAIIPFRVNEHTRGNDLLKFNDYLAMGKRVVCTPTGGAHKFEGLLRIADTAAASVAAVEAALREDPKELRAARQARARENSWTARAAGVAAALRAALADRCTDPEPTAGAPRD